MERRWSGMEQKAMTVRLDPEQAAQLEAVAEVNGAPVSEEIRRAISQYIDARRGDKEFQARLQASLERHREVLEKLAR
jgi:predicted transcriptional regulator